MGKEKSIYLELKEFELKNPGILFNQDFKKAGYREFKVITNKTEPLKYYEKNLRADKLIKILLKNISEKEKISKLKEYLLLYPVIDYYENFINMYKVLTDDNNQFKEETSLIVKKLLINSSNSEEVKFSLLISSLCSFDGLDEILDVFSIHNDFLFYVIMALEQMGGQNHKIFKIAQKSKWYGRIFSLMNLRPVTDEIKKWIIEEGMDNGTGKVDLLYYGMLSIDLLEYLERNDYKGENVEIIAKAFCILLSEYSISDIDNERKVLTKLLNVIDKGSGDIYSLYTVASILYSIEAMVIDNIGAKNTKELFQPEEDYKDIMEICTKVCSKESWHKIIEAHIGDSEVETGVVLSCIDRTGYKLTTKEFGVLLEREITNPLLYQYAFSRGTKSMRKSAIKLGLGKLPLKEMLTGPDEFRVNTISYEEIGQICFFVLVKYATMEELGDRYKEINLKALNSPLIETRTQASLNLRKIRDDFNEADKKKIEEAIKNEMLKAIRRNLKALLIKPEGKEKKYVEVHDNMLIDPHIKDIKLITLNIAGTQYIDMSEVYNKVIEGELLYLKRDPENDYDENAIELITMDGYILGYVPRENNLILRNLLDKGKYLYAIINEINEDYTNINIKIYLSYRDVIEEITSTLSLLSGERESFLQ